MKQEPGNGLKTAELAVRFEELTKTIRMQFDSQNEVLKELKFDVSNLKQPRSTNWSAVGAVITVVIFLISTICGIAGLYFSFRINEVKAENEKAIVVMQNQVSTMYSEAKRQNGYIDMLMRKELGLKPEPVTKE